MDRHASWEARFLPNVIQPVMPFLIQHGILEYCGALQYLCFTRALGCCQAYIMDTIDHMAFFFKSPTPLSLMPILMRIEAIVRMIENQLVGYAFSWAQILNSLSRGLVLRPSTGPWPTLLLR